MSASNIYAVDIIVNGNPCKKYTHEGRTYIEAKIGTEYEIKIHNSGFNRLLAVSSVDSLNVLTGEPASTEDSGYVINAYDSLRIKGFRYSDNNVAAFKFSSKEDSYAKSTGNGQNVGVIGVHLFGENVHLLNASIPNHPVYRHPINIPTWTGGQQLCDTVQFYGHSTISANGMCGNSVDGGTNCFNASLLRNFDVGTSWGGVKDSKVNEVTFDRGSLIVAYDIYYASREALLRIGVPLSSELKVSFPESFPKKYAAPPAGWIPR